MQNVGTYDAIFRITTGSLLLAWASSQSKWGVGTALVAAFGASKIAEGITRYCPLNSAFGISSVEEDDDKVFFHLGPIEYHRIRRPQVRTLWGRPEFERDEISYRAPTAMETSGWNWDAQSSND